MSSESDQDTTGTKRVHETKTVNSREACITIWKLSTVVIPLTGQNKERAFFLPRSDATLTLTQLGQAFQSTWS